MGIYLNIVQILLLLGTINGFIWTILIWFNKNKQQANIYLGVLVFLFSLGSIKIILQEHIIGFNYILPVPLLYQFALGPLLYFYLKSSLDKTYRTNIWVFAHFIPSLVFDVFVLFLFFRLKQLGYIALIEKLSFMLDLLALVFFAGYWVLSFNLTKKYQISNDKQANRLSVNWASMTTIASAFIVLAWLVYIIWVLVFGSRLVAGIQPYYPIYLIFCICIYSIGLSGYYRPEIGMLSVPPRDKKLMMSNVELMKKKKFISESMENDTLYRDDQLSLQKLAKALNLPINELSYVINTGFEMNFNDLINEYRILEFKQRLSGPDSKKYNMLGIAYEVGFNSKASFYRAFKKSTHTTPAEFYDAISKKG